MFKFSLWGLNKLKMVLIRLSNLPIFFYGCTHFINYKEHLEQVNILVKFVKMGRVGICLEVVLEIYLE